MTLEQREAVRQLVLAQSTLESCKEAAKEVWKRRCRSDRPIRLSLQERVSNFSCVMPEGIPMSRVIGQMPEKGLRPSRAAYRGGYRLKQDWHSLKVNKRSELIAAGLPEELAGQIISAQAQKIVIKFIGPREVKGMRERG